MAVIGTATVNCFSLFIAKCARFKKNREKLFDKTVEFRKCDNDCKTGQ